MSVSKNSIKKLFDELLREKRGFKYIISVKITLNPAGKYWSPGRPPPTSRGRPLKILFDRPRDVPIRRPGVVLKWRPRDVLIWRSRDVPGRLIRDVPRTFSGRPLEDLESTQTWMSNFFLTFLSELIRLTKSKSISTLKEYWESSKTSKMEHFLQN